MVKISELWRIEKMHNEQRAKELEFFLKVHEKITEVGVTYNFTCPKCGGTIIACKAPNGHLHMHCDNCSFAIIE